MSAFDRFATKKYVPKEKTEDVPVILNNNGLLEGWLLKRGDKGLTKALVDLTWKKRYFRQNGSKLGYFDGKNSPNPKGEINLLDVISVDPVQSPMFGFHIVTRDRIYIVRTKSPPERDLWVRMLRDRCPNLSAKTSPRVIAPDVTTPIEPIPHIRSSSISSTSSSSTNTSMNMAYTMPEQQPQPQQQQQQPVPISPRYLDEDPNPQPSISVSTINLNQTVERTPVAYAPGGIPIYADSNYPSMVQPSGMIVDPYAHMTSSPRQEAPPAEPAPSPYQYSQ